MLEGKTVAVTGATGFLGSHIARTLAEAGADVVGVVRSPEKGAWLAPWGIRWAKADLRDPDSLARAFRGCDAVVANAALSTRGRASLAAFTEANQTGAVHQAQAAVQAGVTRLVHISTIAVYRPQLFTVNGHDRMLLDGPPLAWSFLTTNWRYALTKARGERDLWALADAHGLELTALRPGPIYGSRDHKMTESYRKRLTGSFTVAPTVQLPHVHGADVAIAVRGALANPASIGRAYNVTGPRTSPFEVLRTWKELTGATTRLVPLPVPAWLDYDDTPAERDLGFQGRSIRAGIEEVLAAR